MRFTVAGPQGMGIVQTQVPKSRRRGDFKYIIFEHRPSRKAVMVLDNRGEKGADPKAGGVPAPALHKKRGQAAFLQAELLPEVEKLQLSTKPREEGFIFVSAVCMVWSDRRKQA